jgi:P27 family predicted phage terminase small subunit
VPLGSVPDAHEVRAGGIGLSWEDLPAVLDEAAAAEWRRLAQVYELHPTRFREGDRAILAAFCIAWSIYLQASAELAADGLLVPGRSAPDRGRQVKSPAMVVWVQAGTQLRHLASALGLSPDARGRSGIKEIEPIEDENSDLLGPHNSRFLS